MTSESPTLPPEASGLTAPGVPVVGGGEFLNMGLSILVVVAVIVLIGWLYSRTRFVSGGAGDLISVVASRALGPKERLLLVEVADQQLLVGMTSTAVQTLHVFDTPVRPAAKVSDSPGFKGRLQKALREMRS